MIKGEDKIIIPKDSIIILSRGEYEDYSIDSICVALMDIDLEYWIKERQSLGMELVNPLRVPVLSCFIRHMIDKLGDGWMRGQWDVDSGFADWLEWKGLLKKLEHFELHRGCRTRFN